MNSEYSLIQLAVRKPQIALDLKNKGFRKKYFNNVSLGKIFDLICTTYSVSKSVLTSEELLQYGFKLDQTEILQTPEHLSEIIIKNYNNRLMREVITETSRKLMEEDSDAYLAKNFFLNQLNKMASLEDKKKYSNAVDVAEDILTIYEERKKKIELGLQGITFGLSALDSHVMGLGKNWLTVIAARNKVGKSWLLAHMVLDNWRNKKNIAVFSCEMTQEQFLERMLCMESKTNPERFLHGTCSEDELNNFKKAKKEAELNFGKCFITDTRETLEEIKEAVLEMNKDHPDYPVEAVFIDSVYRLNIPGESENVRQKRIAMQCKKLAKDLMVPVVVVVQLNRDYDKENEGKTTIQGGNRSVSGSDAYNTEADLLIILHKVTEQYANFKYINMYLQAFRHGKDNIPYMLEVDLEIPRIKQEDYFYAKSRINADLEAPKSKNGNKMMSIASKIMQPSNESADLIVEDADTGFLENWKQTVNELD